jgi:hypothetical protein
MSIYLYNNMEQRLIKVHTFAHREVPSAVMRTQRNKKKENDRL